MTACVNRKHTKKVAAVVTASLVGALSLGVAPVAAVADTGIETLAADWYTDVTVSRATDGKGGTVSNPGQAVFTKSTANQKFLVPVEVKNDYATTYVDQSKFDINYYTTSTGGTAVATISNGSLTRAESFFNSAPAGTYYVSVEYNGKETNRVAFKITEDSYDGAYVYELAADGSTDDTTFVYNGGDQTSNVKIAKADGTPITEGSYVIRNSKGVLTTNATGVTEAGNYTVVLTVGGKDYNIPFTVEKLNLADASFTYDDCTSAGFPTGANVAALNTDALAKVKLNGAPMSSALKGELEVKSVSGPAGNTYFNNAAKGEYTFTIGENRDNPSIDGTATVKFTYLDTNLVTATGAVKYGSQVVTNSGIINISLVDGESFDASKLKVVNGDTTYSGDQLEITYTNHDNGEVVDASALSARGTYDVHLRLKPFQTFAGDQWVGGSIDFQVEVSGTTLNANKKVAFYLNGELAGNTPSVTYDGTDQLEKLDVVVKDADGNDLVEGTDYTVVAELNGKEVDSVVNHGTYDIKVKALTFEFSNPSDAEIQLTVDQVDLSTLIPSVEAMAIDADDKTGEIKTTAEGNEFYVPYTGSAVSIPAVTYEVKKGNDYTYVTLDQSLYNIVSVSDGTSVVKDAVDEGDYTVTIALTDAAGDNYTLGTSAGKFTFTVQEFGHFADVQPDAWYAVAVDKAYSLYYINGISNTNLFAPEADITRADAVCILYNMAGGDDIYGGDDFKFNEDYGYNTGFSDVDGHAYFAKALAWAHASGVANGSNGEFRPYDKITREEFASLLANFAKSKGDFVAADDEALDSMSDANTVSDWAKDNVAWAVENGVMGNGGFVAGQSNIKRAEVAAMGVNYQPENLINKTR